MICQNLTTQNDIDNLFWNTLRREAWKNAQDPHTVLDGLGLIPGIGEAADGVNALLYVLGPV